MPELTPVQKASMKVNDLLDGGYLPTDVARTFLIETTAEASLLKLATTFPMASHTGKAPSISFGTDPILHAAQEGVAFGEALQSKPTTDEVEIVSKEYKAEVPLTKQTIEDNVEQENFIQTVMKLMQPKLAIDIERLVVLSDTDSDDNDLSKQDGLLELVGSHTVNGGGTAIGDTLLESTVEKMPVQFLANRRALRFLCSHRIDARYRKWRRNRQGVLGDATLTGHDPITFDGIDLEPIVSFPDTLGIGTYSSIVLMDPKNLQVGFWKNISFETEVSARAGTMTIVARLRFGIGLKEENGTVELYSIDAA